MDEEQRRLKRYKLMFARFNWMEQKISYMDELLLPV